MKKLIPMLLIIVLLTACGEQEDLPAEEKSPPVGEMTLPESIYTGEDAGACDYTMTTEWEEYDPSVKTIWYFLENGSGQEIMTGREDHLERLGPDGTWQTLPMKENTGWTMEGLIVPAGETIALNCWLGMYDHDYSDGTYRIVKEVEGQTCTAEFCLKAGAAISADAPYGFAPLEDLPETYGAAQASEDDVVYTNDGVKNGGAVETFLDKVSLGVPSQLRTVQDYGENTPMLIDTIYENGHFLWRMRQGDYVAEQRFSYIVTDGTDLYLSNGADWETAERYAGKELAWLVPMETAGAAEIEAVEKLTADRIEANVTRYRVWSADGVWDAALTDVPTEFSVSWQKPGEGSGGRTYDLNHWDGLETAIWGLEWQEDGKLLLVCETVDGSSSRLLFDPETERLTTEF